MYKSEQTKEPSFDRLPMSSLRLGPQGSWGVESNATAAGGTVCYVV